MWQRICLLWSLSLALFALAACTASGETAEGPDISVIDNVASSGSVSKSSSSNGPGGDSSSVSICLSGKKFPMRL